MALTKVDTRMVFEKNGGVSQRFLNQVSLSPTVPAGGVAVGSNLYADEVIEYSDGGQDYRVHVYKTSGIFIAESDITADVLVVAGGGSGGAYGHGGGGGAGEMYESIGSTLTNGSYTVIVGAGAAVPTTNDSSATSNGKTGNDSSFNGNTCAGGGGGGRGDIAGNSGGSGGGGGYNQNGGSSVKTASGYGNIGGAGAGTTCRGAGGGGGAGAVGGNGTASPKSAGDGGIGRISNLVPYNLFWNVEQVSGTDVYYAAGGGGGALYTSGFNGNPWTTFAGNGGLGGGGYGSANDGNINHNGSRKDGVANSGGGGGGVSDDYGLISCGQGGSGIVIIRVHL